MHSRRRHPGRLRHVARAPVGGVLRLRLKRPRNDVFDAIVADLARGPASRLIVEAIQAALCEPLAPYANGLPGHANRVGNLAIVQSLGGTQDDLGPLGISACSLATPNETLQNIALVRAQLDRDHLPRRSRRHRALRITSTTESRHATYG
jgi:hypothetical protein